MSTRASATTDPTRYHHGDLRRALLDSAGAILSETGRWDFSLREVARRAGVSHNAPYRHFPDKEALLCAIGVAGYDALHAHSMAAVKRTSTPAETLKALGQAYIEFGVSNPALYRLMFGQGLPNISGLPPALMEAVNAARAVLREAILAGARTRAFTVNPEDADEVRAAAVAAWSLVHGFTLLTIDRVVEREIGPGVVQDLAGQVAARFIVGLTPKR
ncbi:MAG TPA: TetR/AcrR family transcriptional regulator [Acidisoma sp.]|nr:TetR/AcrR family transcriptional regulator [Acidisoma sp.]